MDALLEYFPVILYILGSILLVILIILGIKLITTINKANAILEDAYNKTKSLNGLFHIIDSITDSLSTVSDSIAAGLTNVIGKLFHRKRKENEEDE